MKMELLNVFLDILATPAILVGVFALIGLLLQKKEVSQVISGTLKTVLGFILITAGGNVIISSLDVFGQMFNRAFSISGSFRTMKPLWLWLKAHLGRKRL